MMEKWLNRKQGITPLASWRRWWRFDPVYYFPLLLAEACKVSVRLEALAVDDGGAALVVLLLGDPHLLEGGEGSQDGASDPDGALPLGGSDDLDLDGGGGKGGDHRSPREEVLRLDRRLHPGFPLHLPADVDLQAGVRRVR